MEQKGIASSKTDYKIDLEVSVGESNKAKPASAYTGEGFSYTLQAL